MPAEPAVSLAELVAAVSLAADLGAGQPPEHALRTCVLACRLAGDAGLGAEERRDVYHVALLRSIGCTSDAHEQAAIFGDEIAARGELNLATHLAPRELLAVLARHVGAGAPAGRRARLLAGTVAGERALPRRIATAHCETAERLAGGLGFAAPVRAALRAIFERWDGKGFPRGIAGEAIPAASRLVQAAYDAALLYRARGSDGTAAALRRAAGSALDPAVAELAASPDALRETLEVAEPWDAVLELDPAAGASLGEEALAGGCRVAGEFADLKSVFLLGHSAAVAELAEAAAWRLGLGAPDAVRVSLAGHLHELGRVPVSTAIWERAGSLGAADWDAVRLHPYYTERFLSRSRGLAELGALASSHRERLDSSGCHRGLRADSLTPAARVLEAADVYQALLEPRPHRGEVAPEQAAETLRAEVREGRLDGEAAAAVLEAAGHRGAAARRERPAGLTEREVEVLCLLARGLSNKAIAARLVLSPKTVGRHVEHVYAKAGVSTRAAAALFAVQSGLFEMGYSPDPAAAGRS